MPNLQLRIKSTSLENLRTVALHKGAAPGKTLTQMLITYYQSGKCRPKELKAPSLVTATMLSVDNTAASFLTYMMSQSGKRQNEVIEEAIEYAASKELAQIKRKEHIESLHKYWCNAHSEWSQSYLEEMGLTDTTFDEWLERELELYDEILAES